MLGSTRATNMARPSEDKNVHRGRTVSVPYSLYSQCPVEGPPTVGPHYLSV